MGQTGKHTWDLVHQYHRCPACGYILESREDYTYLMGTYQKDLVCDRCQHPFTLTKRGSRPIGPIFGKAASHEIEWE